jgi:hypothetical protein
MTRFGPSFQSVIAVAFLLKLLAVARSDERHYRRIVTGAY